MSGTSRLGRVAMAVGVCGLVAGAKGQLLEVDVSFDRTAIGIGETATATLTAELIGFGEDAYFASVSIDLIQFGFGRVLASPATGLDWANPLLGGVAAGTPSGGDLIGIFGAQLSQLPPIDDSNPFVVLEWVVAGVSEGDIEYRAQLAGAAPGSFGVIDRTLDPFAPPVFYSTGTAGLRFGSASLRVVPGAPAPALLFGACCLRSWRRRVARGGGARG